MLKLYGIKYSILGKVLSGTISLENASSRPWAVASSAVGTVSLLWNYLASRRVGLTADDLENPGISRLKQLCASFGIGLRDAAKLSC